MKQGRLPAWLLAFGDTLLLPVVLALWCINAFALVLLGVGFLTFVLIGEGVRIEWALWFSFAFVLGALNFRICYRWLGEAPSYRGLPWYLVNSALIVLTFEMLTW